MTSENNNLGVTELRMLSPSSQNTATAPELTEMQEQQLPLYENGTRLTGEGGAGHSGYTGRGPQRKVKFLQKLINFCGDPKRREQTCSKRNKTFTLCKDEHDHANRERERDQRIYQSVLKNRHNDPLHPRSCLNT